MSKTNVGLKKKKKEWEEDRKIVKDSRKSAIKKIKEWEKSEKKNLEGEKNDEKVNFEIISELKELKPFTELKKEWETLDWEETEEVEEESEEMEETENESRTKAFGLKLWGEFWNDPEVLWEEDPNLFSWAVQKIKNLKYFNELKKEWEKNQPESGKEKNLDHYFPHPDWLIKETIATPEAVKKKDFGNWMTAFAVGGLAFLGLLIVLSAVCVSSCQVQPTFNEDGLPLIVNGTHIMRPVNIPLQILESQLMVVFIATIIGPVVARILKEKYDIQIEASQFNMIMQDAISAVKMYNKEANKLRDKDGKLDEVSQRKLRNLAFAAIADNYDIKKYNELVKNVGVQVFEKAIESAVTDDKLKRLPLEREKIKEIIGQAIDAVPQIVEWQKTDNDAKKVFLDGHVRRLLATIGVEGWAHKQLENIFDAEVNNRLLAAAIADKNELLKAIKNKDEYLLYTSTVLSAVSDSLAKSTENKSNTKS